MNKTKKLFVIGSLLLGLVFAVSACAEPETFTPPEPGDHVLTINDAYDWNEDETGSTRPELGGGYEPQVPVKDALLTIAESSSIRFAGGSTTMTLPVGQLLKQEDFDASTLGGHTVGGLGILGEEGEIRSFRSLASFSAQEPLTVLPYFAPENGDAYEFGSNRVGDYYYDGEGNGLWTDAPLTTSYALIDGYMGTRIETEGSLTENSYFRTVTVCEREAGQTYTYRYKFQNFGEAAISFTVYQMFTGQDWADSTTNVSSKTITLEAGAVSDWTALTVANDKNDGNTLTLIRFDQAVEGFALGVSMSVENTTPTKPAKITLDLPSGFTVNGYQTDVRTNDRLVLPTADQIINNTGHNLLYWEYADGTRAEAGVRIQGDITLRPVLTEDAVVSIQAPEGLTVSGYPMTLQTGDRLVLPSEDQITNNTGNRLLYWVYAGTDQRANAGEPVTGNVTLAPVLSEDAKITLNLPAGFTVSSSYVTDVQTGDALTMPTADQITNNTGRTLLGWYNVETGAAITSSAVVDDTAITIAPYFEHENGTALVPCTGADNATVPDYVGHYDENNVFTHWKDEAGDNIPQEDVFRTSTSYYGGQRGVLLESIYDGGFIVNDAFRCKTASDPDMDGTITYRIYYSITNLGTKDLNFHVYQVLSQTNLGTAIDLGNKTFAVGETVEFSVELRADNSNLMTMFVFNEAADGIKLKIDMSMQGIEADVSFDMPDGIEVSPDYDAAYRQGEALVLPTADQIDNTTDYNVIGWTYADGTPAADGDIIKGDVTLRPVLSEPATITITPTDGITISPDYETDVWMGSELVLPTAEQITNTTGNKIIGWTYADGTPAANGDIIEGDITLTPVLSENATVTVDLPDGLQLSPDYTAPTQTGDALVVPTADQIVGTPEGGRELIGWYIKETGEIITADTVVEDTTVTIAPYWTRTEDSLKVTGGDGNGSDPVFCNEQSALRPSQIRLPGETGGSGLTQADWFDVISGGRWTNDTVVSGEEGEYAELGNVLSTVDGKTFEAGMTFRCATILSGGDATPIPVGEPVTIRMNLENRGNSAIHLTMWGVNSGIDHEGEAQDIDLGVGESMTVEFTVTYENGNPNKNAMVFFQVDEALVNMELGVSFNVSLG